MSDHRSGFYYLHTEGALIFKPHLTHRERDLIESPFVKCYWPFEWGHRSHAWRIIIEGTVAEVNPDRIRVLAELWECDDKDAKNFAIYLGVKLHEPTGTDMAWVASIPESHSRVRGEGVTATEALVKLCRSLGWKAAKGNLSFEELVKAA